MSEEKAGQGKTLEMRVAALEDKLAKLSITEEEMKAYEKVSALMGTGAAAEPRLSPQTCTISHRPCVISPIYRPCIITPISPICYECTCGPCACDPYAYARTMGGGFGSFGR